MKTKEEIAKRSAAYNKKHKEEIAIKHAKYYKNHNKHNNLSEYKKQ